MRNKITVFIFCCLFGFFFAVSLLKPQTVFSPVENRYLQTRPAFSLQNFQTGRFGKEYESYLSDQFPWRDSWISLKSSAELAIGKTELKNIYLGKDHYLIENFPESVFSSPQAHKNLERVGSFAESAARILKERQSRTPEASAKDFSLKLMLVPTASQILTEKLPPFASPYSQETFLEQAKEAVTAEHFLNLLPVLNAHKKEYIYYRTDHHWTALGAFYAYQSWASSVGLAPLSKEEFRIETVSREFFGTLDSKIHLGSVPDSIDTYTSSAEFSLIYDQSDDIRSSMFDLSALKTRDQYRVYMGGNHGLVEITRTDAPSSRKLLVVKDSFAHCFVPMAAGHFSYTAMADLRFYRGDLLSLIREKEITDVLILYSTANFAADNNMGRLISNP